MHCKSNSWYVTLQNLSYLGTEHCTLRVVLNILVHQPENNENRLSTQNITHSNLMFTDPGSKFIGPPPI